MDNFTIINLQAVRGTIGIILGFRWWIKPRLANLSLHDALLPFVFLNVFRYLGLSFMAKEQFYDGFPTTFLNTVGILDFTTAILAVIAATALKNKWSRAIPLVWIFNIVGFGDLITAFPQFFGLKLYDQNLGFIWLLFVTYGLITFLSHIYIFGRLFKNLRKKKMPIKTVASVLISLGLFASQSIKAQDVYAGKATKVEEEISAEFPFESKFIEIGHEKVHYVESGEGDPVLLLHGLPANLYLYRNIIPKIDSNKKVIALDFLGFGKSSFPADSNTSVEVQYQMLKDFIEKKELKNVTLFVQDIGSIAGMLYAIREPQNVKGITLFEAPFMPAEVMYDQLPFSFRAFMRITRTKKGNEKWMVKRNFAGKKLAVNFFTGRKLPKEAYPFYTQPWNEKERRYAITRGPDPAVLSFTKGKGESEFATLLDTISNGMKATELPILYFYAKKGLVNRKEAVEYAKENFKNATHIYLGKGKHFLTESHPKQMSEEFNQWFDSLN